MNKVVVLGGGGFIGSYLVRRLVNEGFRVRAVDLKKPDFSESMADEFVVGDLRDINFAKRVLANVDDVYQLAADMGGLGFIGGDHDAEIWLNSGRINLNVAQAISDRPVQRLFFSSSACVYSTQQCEESSVYPAEPDNEYGWEKLMAERMYLSLQRLNTVDIKIARYHSVIGPEGTWRGGREKVVAALCRKVAEAQNGEAIEVWGDGQQTRSFMDIDECLEGARRLMESSETGPLNIGSEEMVTINALAELIIEISGKQLGVKNIAGPEGVRGRNSDNRLIQKKLGWAPSAPLHEGLAKTYWWIEAQVKIMSRDF